MTVTFKINERDELVEDHGSFTVTYPDHRGFGDLTGYYTFKDPNLAEKVRINARILPAGHYYVFTKRI
jgi:hypothetical protein